MFSRPFDNMPKVDLIDEGPASDSGEQVEIRVEGEGSACDHPVVNQFDQAASVSEHQEPPALAARQHLHLEDVNATRKRIA